MMSFYKKYYKTVFDIALMLFTVYLFMLLFSYLYRIATPIFLALLIYAAIEPLAKFLNRKGIKKSLATAISMMLFIIIILAVLVGLGAIFATQLDNIKGLIPTYSTNFQDQVVENTNYLKQKWDNLPPELADRIIEYSSKVAKYASDFTTWFLTWLMGWLTSFTKFLTNFFIGIILAYFLSVEIDTWKRMATEHTPGTFKTAFRFLKENVLIGIVTYIKSTLKLVSITGVLVFVGLLLFGVSNAFSVALLCAFFDVLPLLGVSTFFLPWIAYLFIVGKTMLAVKISILTVIVLLVRQILEPKITGDSLGVSAFTMLSFMIISLSLFGVAGLILSPVLIITIKALNEQGYLKRWIRKPEDDFTPEYID
jgi:sporulation integral membrane protein YtvI